MESVALTPELTMLRAGRFQFYLWDDGQARVLIDTGPAGSRDGVADRVDGLDLVVLTHCHYDHCGSAAELRTWGGAEVVAGKGDAPVIRGDRPAPPPVLLDWEQALWNELSADLPWESAPVAVDREVTGGEILPFGGGATVVATPGHTAGSIAIHLPQCGILFTGDTVARVDSVMLGVFNQDREQTAESFRRLADLEADTVCFGHGEPIVGGAAAQLAEAASQL